MTVKFVQTKTQLASALTISRTSLWQFFKLPDHPKARADGRYSVQQWAAYISSKAERITTGDGTIPLSIKDATRIELLRITISRQKLLLETERNSLLPREQIIDECLKILQALDYRLRRIFEVELPTKCVGLDPLKIKKLGCSLFDAAMLKTIHDLKTAIPPKADAAKDDREQIRLEGCA